MRRLLTIAVAFVLTISGFVMLNTSAANAVNCNGYVALTFDDGPVANDFGLLAALDTAGFKVTFFNTGLNTATYPAKAREQLARGHQIGNHTYDHPNLANLGYAERWGQIHLTDQIFVENGLPKPNLFRPPYGVGASAWEFMGSEYKMALWTKDTNDWQNQGVPSIMASLANLQAGDIILMHEGYQFTVQAIPQIKTLMDSKGLCAGKLVDGNSWVEWPGYSNVEPAAW